MRTPTRLALLLCLLAASQTQAQTPCDVPATPALVVNPRLVYAILSEFDRTLLDGATVAIPGYEVAYFSLPNVLEPFQSAGQIPRADWTREGDTRCYGASLPGLAAVPIGQRWYPRLRAVGDPSIGTSAWSDVGSPFGRETAPVPPGPPQVRP